MRYLQERTLAGIQRRLHRMHDRKSSAGHRIFACCAGGQQYRGKIAVVIEIVSCDFILVCTSGSLNTAAFPCFLSHVKYEPIHINHGLEVQYQHAQVSNFQFFPSCITLLFYCETWQCFTIFSGVLTFHTFNSVLFVIC